MLNNPALLRTIGLGALAVIVLATAHGILVHRGIWLDFANFYDAGSKALLGEMATLYDEFAQIGGEKPFGNMAFFSAPLSSYAYVPFAVLDPNTGATAFKLASAACIYAGLGLLFYHYRVLVPDTTRDRALYFAAFAVAAMLFQPFWTVFQVGGQSTAFVFLLFVIGLILYEREAYGWVAVLFVPIVLIKPAFGLAAFLLFVVSPRQFRLVALVVGGAAVLASLALAGWDAHLAFLERVQLKGTDLATPQYNSNLWGWVEPFVLDRQVYETDGAVPPALPIAVLALRLVTAAALVWMMVSALRSDLAPPARRNLVYLLIMAAALVMTPVVWAHYLMMLFPLVVHVIVFRDQLPTLAKAMVILALLAAQIQNLWILNTIIKVVGIETWTKLVGVSVMRDATMFLIIACILLFARAMLRTGRDPAWAAY